MPTSNFNHSHSIMFGEELVHMGGRDDMRRLTPAASSALFVPSYQLSARPALGLR